MNYAITVTNNGVGISVIAIDSQINTILFEKFSKSGGCNYFIATKEEDLEKYLIYQFHYMNLVSHYNIKLNFEFEECEKSNLELILKIIKILIIYVIFLLIFLLI